MRLYFAGKKEYFYEQLEDFIKTRPNVRDKIKALGFVPDDELKWLFENAKCYVFATKAEGFGLPAIEAMVHGLPVTASNIPVLTEVLGDAAHFFSPDDPSSVAKAVDDVLNSPQLRKELIARGHKQIKKYSWERMAQETKKVYEAVLAG